MSKIVDREGLKAFRERLDEKYVIEGEYSPQTSVGLADNLTPYSEDSGTEQSNPFISNGTGTNNNQEIVTVGDYGLLRSKNGNTVCVNQLVQNGDFSTSTGWSFSQCSVAVSNNKLTITCLSEQSGGNVYYTGDYLSFNVVENHKYLVSFYGKSDTGYIGFRRLGSAYNNVAISSSSLTRYDLLLNGSSSGSFTIYPFGLNSVNQNDTCELKSFVIIDLYQWFNGNIPQDILDNPSHFFWYYNGSLAYNTGTLVNANGVKLVSTGRNVWNEETESGYIGSSSGSDIASNDYRRCVGFIKIVPNTTYYFKSSASLNIRYYDINKNYIGAGVSVQNGTQISPSNACYLRFYYTGTTYNNDITISLYYSPEQGGEGYDKYYPYETPYEVNTGNETLRSAGSVYDYKEPNGTIHRLVGSITINDLDLTYDSTNLRFEAPLQTMLYGNARTIKLFSPLYTCLSSGETFDANWDMVIYNAGSTASRRIYIHDHRYNSVSAFKQAQGNQPIYYPLAEPTTEQGTPFAENLPINDYGMLYWDSDIPQGNTIFFPINYKGFLDDMYSRVEGDSSKYVIDTQLQASETQRDTIDTQLKNAIGGTLRQLLAISQSIDFNNTDFVDLGTINWSYNSGSTYFYASISGTNIKVPSNNDTRPNIMCSLYQLATANGIISTSNNMILGITGDGYIVVRNTSYTDTTTFKNAMKGVLLAYEKA